VDLCSLTHLATVLSIWFIGIIPSRTQQWGLGSATPPWVKLINEKQLLCFRDWFVWRWNPTDVIPVGIYSKKPLKRILMSNNQNSIESIRVPPLVFFWSLAQVKGTTPLEGSPNWSPDERMSRWVALSRWGNEASHMGWNFPNNPTFRASQSTYLFLVSFLKVSPNKEQT